MNNRQAFLDMIAYSEIGPALLAVSDNGYNVLVGSTAERPLLFTSYSTHPNLLNVKMNSTAAGRYQLLHRYFEAYQRALKLPDFSPASQDAIALQQIKERRALEDIDTGRFSDAVSKVSNIWASLPGPGNTYGQHQNKLSALENAYAQAGGTLA